MEFLAGETISVKINGKISLCSYVSNTVMDGVSFIKEQLTGEKFFIETNKLRYPLASDFRINDIMVCMSETDSDEPVAYLIRVDKINDNYLEVFVNQKKFSLANKALKKVVLISRKDLCN